MTRSAPADIEEEASQALPGLFLSVIDDYYPDPQKVREYALNCEYDRPFTGNWQGLHSLQRHPDTGQVFADIASRLPLDGAPNWQEIEESFQFWGRPSAGVFALLLQGQTDAVHSHKRTGRWAGLCYLSEMQTYGPTDGLNLYQHLETGAVSCASATPTQLERYRRDGENKNLWRLEMTVPMAFNRMIIFDGQFFHAASDGFGFGPHNGRLAQLFAIDLG